MIVRGVALMDRGTAHHFSRWDGFEADNERQVQCAGSESATLRTHVNITGLRASGWRGHDGVESEGFASYSVSLKVSRTAIVGTYLLRSLRPFGEHRGARVDPKGRQIFHGWVVCGRASPPLIRHYWLLQA